MTESGKEYAGSLFPFTSYPDEKLAHLPIVSS